MLEFAPLPLTIKPKRTSPKRTLEDKQRTNERLQKELAKDLAATDRAARTYFPPTRKGTSLNPNANVTFDCVDSHFLNREAHEEAKAIQEGWRRKPWKGFVWYGRTHEPNSKPERVWTEPSMHLQWTGAEWKPYKRQDGTAAIPGMSASSNVSVELTEALQRAIEIGKSGGIADAEMNAAYVEYLADPIGQRDSLFLTISAFVRSSKRGSQVSRKFKNKPEIYMDRDDIFDEFAINLLHRIENGQYTHEGKMQNWINFIWGSFFFKGVETEIYEYENRNYFVNKLDKDLEGYEDQEHSVGLYQLEDEQGQREQVGYAAPISRDRIFRQMNKPTQAIVQMLAEGLTQDEIAVNLKISTRQLRRRMDKAIEEGETLRSATLHSVQGCAEENNLLPWPSDECIGDIMGCAAPVENKLAQMVEDFGSAITAAQLAKILQCSRREIYKLIDQKRLPALKVGTMVRLDPGTVAHWIRSKMTIAA